MKMSEAGSETQEGTNLAKTGPERAGSLPQVAETETSTQQVTGKKLENLRVSLRTEAPPMKPASEGSIFTVAGPAYEKHYSEIAESRYNTGPLGGHGHALIKEAGQVSNSSIVIEVGCNTGMFLEQWKKETGVYIKGFDINKEAIVSAKDKGLDAEYALAEALPLNDNSVDLLTSLHTYEHVENLPKSFQEMERVLKPGARAVIIVPPNLLGLETLKVAIEDLPENMKGKGPFGFIRTLSNGYRHARQLHRSIMGGPIGGARRHVEKILKQNGISLKVKGGMRPNLMFANLLVFEKPAS